VIIFCISTNNCIAIVGGYAIIGVNKGKFVGKVSMPGRLCFINLGRAVAV
jgi:hypothetical protein